MIRCCRAEHFKNSRSIGDCGRTGRILVGYHIFNPD